MTTAEAIQLIRPGININVAPQIWADLGCGSGTFTTALATLLPRNSTVHAIDSKPQIIPLRIGDTVINFRVMDFEREDPGFNGLDGILLANSLHYIAQPSSLIKRMTSWLHADRGEFLFVEYNRRQSNRWVPYPIPFNHLNILFEGTDFTSIRKIGERASVYGQGMMYSCIVSRLTAHDSIHD